MLFPSSSLTALGPLAASVIVALVGCGGIAVVDRFDSPAVGAGGSPSLAVTATAAASTSGASTGGASSSSVGGAGGGAVIDAGSPCVPQPSGTGGTGGYMDPVCSDLAVLAVSNPVLVDADEDGKFEAGETVFLKVHLDEIAGVGFEYSPGVVFAADTAGVTVSAGDWNSKIAACQTQPMSALISIGSNIAPGTVVTITARVAISGYECPDAYSIAIPFTVQD